jgi:hypothetical protein
MSSISDTNLQIAISKLPQSNYVTAVAAVASPNQTYIEQVMTAKNLIKKGVQTVNDKEHTTGQRFATDSWISGGHTTELAMPFDASFQNIGRYLYAVMGAGGAPTAQGSLWRYLLKFLDTKISQQLPAYTIIEHASPANGGLDVKVPSMVAKSLKLSGDGAAKCAGEVMWVGSGEYVQPSGMTWATHVSATQGTQVPIYNTTSKLTRSDAPGGGNAVNRSLCENLGWEINLTNTFDENDYGCVRLFNTADVAKGILRSHLLLVDTEISSRFKFKIPQNSNEMTALENQSPLKLLLELLSTETVVATSQILRFDMPLNKYKVVDYSAENGFLYCTIEPETLYSVADSKALEVELINNITSYV